MSIFEERKERLLTEMAKLHGRHELSQEVGPDYFEPGMMEYLEQSDGDWDEDTGRLMLRFESRGTRYDGRTEQIEKVKIGDVIRITRDPGNEYNPNNFLLLTEKGKDVGNMPAELCNAVAPLYDEGSLVIESAKVSFVDPISKRSRHAKQAVLFVEMQAKLSAPKTEPVNAETPEPMVTAAPKAEPAQADPDAVDPYALQLDLKENSFFIGGFEIRKGTTLEEIRQQKFFENAAEIPDFWDAHEVNVFLRHTAEFAGEEWAVQLIFDNGSFHDLWLEHSRLFTQRSLLKNAASNPRLRKNRISLYSKLKSRLDALTGTRGEQHTEEGNLQYIYCFDGHGAMLVQDNKLPGIVIHVQYEDKDASSPSTEKKGGIERLTIAVQRMKECLQKKYGNDVTQYPRDYRELKMQCAELDLSFASLDNTIRRDCGMKPVEFFKSEGLIR